MHVQWRHLTVKRTGMRSEALQQLNSLHSVHFVTHIDTWAAKRQCTRFTTVLITACQLSLPWARSIQCTFYILPCTGLRSTLFHSRSFHQTPVSTATTTLLYCNTHIWPQNMLCHISQSRVVEFSYLQGHVLWRSGVGQWTPQSGTKHNITASFSSSPWILHVTVARADIQSVKIDMAVL